MQLDMDEMQISSNAFLVQIPNISVYKEKSEVPFRGICHSTLAANKARCQLPKVFTS